MTNKFMQFFKPKDSDRFDDTHTETVNHDTDRRNWVIVMAISGVAGLGYASWLGYQHMNQAVDITQVSREFARVDDADFSDNLTQSLQQQQQAAVNTLKKQLADVMATNAVLVQDKDTLTDDIHRIHDDIGALQQQVLAAQTYTTLPTQPLDSPVETMGSQDIFSYQQQPRYAEVPDIKRVQSPPSLPDDTAEASLHGIESFTFASAASVRKTPDNYVPAGAFVTAVMTGGADANAGVNGQADTAPVTFRAINAGFLPNGKHSHLKDCFFTAATYGEISSSRGIVRTDRMSCTLPSGDILDVAVKGTAFNFGRNGIRGTAVMRNGKIIEMAGISGIFSGLGKTAQSLSQTQSISPLGTTSTVNPSQALANMGGAALESVGSKLSDYYIKLAEQYHPVIELNPGSVVNIVFLKGFSLTPTTESTTTASPDPSPAEQHVIALPDALLKGISS